jgi:hypothetical protein
VNPISFQPFEIHLKKNSIIDSTVSVNTNMVRLGFVSLRRKPNSGVKPALAGSAGIPNAG